ncbi:hypothetical protein JHK82_057292 [Glycine max]|nr:hypothetical protein JHK86_057119 [Glycine max]KAG5075948.1 hypothetical protein JHK84_057179 [Glycine max]KAG5078597.1 hypothetical protein JHK82_057292 [Glycine max]KHN20257.1 hypothetical protein glysoja_023820 [Glycine soja]
MYADTHRIYPFVNCESVMVVKAMKWRRITDHYTIPHSTVHALEDCLNLSELNTDFLFSVLQAIENTVTD